MTHDDAALRRNLEDLWRQLGAEGTGDASLRSADLPVDGEERPLRLGLGPDGRRLLLPLRRGVEDELREDRRSSGLRLLRRPLQVDDERVMFADLVCLRPELDGVFTAVCADILLRQEAFGGPPIAHALRALSEWRSLFAGGGRHLTLQQLAGLFGELNILVSLLQHNPGAARFWLGPDGHRHDFVWPGSAVEAKTTISSEGRSVRVHGLDQLTPPAGSKLLVAFQRLETVPAGGVSIPELVERACSIGEARRILGRVKSQDVV